MQRRLGGKGLQNVSDGFYNVDKSNPSIKRAWHEAGKIEALWQSEKIQATLSLCHAKGRFLFEVIPDVFPEGRLTEPELILWGRFLEHREKAQN